MIRHSRVVPSCYVIDIANFMSYNWKECATFVHAKNFQSGCWKDATQALSSRFVHGASWKKTGWKDATTKFRDIHQGEAVVGPAAVEERMRPPSLRHRKVSSPESEKHIGTAPLL
jgi:hypothetical protein